MGKKACSGVFLWCVLAVQPAFSQNDLGSVREDDEGTFTFVWENDVLGGTDRNYTNGLRLSWLSGTHAADGMSEFLATHVLRADGDAFVRRGFALGQSIFTPNDIEAEDPLPNQHPYAGWLYGEYSLLIQRLDVVDRLTFQAGVVGSSSGAEWVQNEVHSIIDSAEARGWDNQIKDEAGVVIAYDRQLRALAELGDSGFGMDLTPNMGLTLGNVHTNARLGLTVRLGQDLRNDFGPPRIRPSLAGAGYFTPEDSVSWYVFAGVEGRAVAHNIFLDGSLFRDGDPSVSSKTFVADAQGGLVVQFGGLQVALTYVERTEEFDEQLTRQRFGALSIGGKF